MPLTPSADAVRKYVRTTVAAHAQMSESQLADSMALKKPPVSLDDNKLAFLATSLRGYVQNFNPFATVTAKDTRKDGQTVRGITDLVAGRIAGKSGAFA